MKRAGVKSSMQVLVMMVFAAMLAVGCAKKPATSPTAADQAGAQQVTQGVEEMGAGETGIGEGMVGDQNAMGMPQAVSSLERIYFNFDRYDLSAEAQATLVNNANYLKANSAQKVRIEGYCDERGSDEYNLALGERRALATQKYLESLGVAKDRLSVISYGEEMPLDPAQTESAYAMNRRAEFKVMP
jgi:peptidoglycan-associated lipoprotein